MQNLKDFLIRNKWAIFFVIAVLSLVALFVWLRWWAFLVLGVLGLAAFFGHLMDRGGVNAIKNFFGKLFSK